MDFRTPVCRLAFLNEKIGIVLIALLALGFAASCRKADALQSPIGTREVSDDLGRRVVVPLKGERVISLAPSVTEMIFAVGAGDRLVGVTTYCNYPAGAAAVEKVGDTQTPNIERIIALKPQIVFISTASQLEAFSKTLDEQGIAVYVTNPKNLDEVFGNMRRLGELFGKEEYAADAVASLAARASFARQGRSHDRDADRGSQRVFVQISNEPLFTIGRDSFLTQLVELAGGVSVTKDVPSGYPKLSKETAAALDPDVIILSESDDNLEPNAVFRNSKAVKNGRVHRVNADILSRPGPRLVDALEQIAARLSEKN